MMKMEKAAPRSNLYPDLSQFYTQSQRDRGSSTTNSNPSGTRSHGNTGAPSNRPSTPQHRHQHDQCLVPTAPPLNDSRDELNDNSQMPPEEPVQDYTMEDLTLDDLTADYTLDDCQVDNYLELEPDYDMDDVDVDEDTLNNLNLTASEKKILHDKNIEVPEPPRDSKDFRAWMTWRTQANRLLAAVILTRKGQHVQVKESEIRRQPLSKQIVQGVLRQARARQPHRARDPAERSSLSECPYVMYGIPRVNLPRKATR